ncbi:MAG: hypothetical protein QM725_04965 [Lacibacter sp.]
MKLNSISTQPLWKIAVKISALGISLVFATYGLVWVILNMLKLVIEGIFY